MGSGEAAMRCAGDGGQHHYFHARLEGSKGLRAPRGSKGVGLCWVMLGLDGFGRLIKPNEH